MIPVIMPRQGQSVESCIITKWHKKVGDVVSKGDLLFSYETDKAAFDEEAKDEGVLLSVISREGDDVPCLQTVCYIGEAGEDASGESAIDVNAALLPKEEQLASDGLNTAILPAVSSIAYNQEQGTESASYRSDENEQEGRQAAQEQHSANISPRARALAMKSGVDISQAVATGPNGRIIARDVQALIDQGKLMTRAAKGTVPVDMQGTGIGGRVTLHDLKQIDHHDTSSKTPSITESAPAQIKTVQYTQKDVPEQSIAGNIAETDAQSAAVTSRAVVQQPAYHDEPLPNIRKRIAKTMQQSIATMAQLTHTATYDATNVVQLRKQFKEQGKHFGMDKVTLGDLVVFAAVRTLMQPDHAHLNAHYLGDSMRYFVDVHLGIAVDTTRGLMVPTIRQANRKSLLELSTEIKTLAAACQSGAIDPDLLTGASFTVSNLGAFMVEHFTPIINPPQTGILGVNTLQQRVRETDGRIEVYPAMSLSLTYDHRALDGAPASRFLRDLKYNLENIQLLMGGGAYHV